MLGQECNTGHLLLKNFPVFNILTAVHFLSKFPTDVNNAMKHYESKTTIVLNGK